RRDLWRSLLPLLVALGPIDQAVRRGSGRAGSPWAARGVMSRSLGLISETNARMRSKWAVHIVVVIPPSTGGATAGGASWVQGHIVGLLSWLLPRWAMSPNRFGDQLLELAVEHGGNFRDVGTPEPAEERGRPVVLDARLSSLVLIDEHSQRG